MAKKYRKKSSEAGNENMKKKIEQDSVEIVERGEAFGKALISLLSLTATDWKGMGSATIGLAMAVAGLKDIAERTGVDIDSLFESELSFFEKLFAETDLTEL